MYLNSSHTPIVSPLQRPLHIELYNPIYVPPDSKKIIKLSLNTPICQVDDISFFAYEPPLMVTKLNILVDELGDSLHKLEYSDIIDHISSPVTVNLSDKIFFIQYNPEDTLCRQCYIIEVDMESTK